MKFAERARFTKGSSIDFTLPVEILGRRGGQSNIDDQRLVAGGMVEFFIRNSPLRDDFRKTPINYRVEFVRWDPGVEYSVNSVTVENHGRFLLITATRT